MQTKQHIPCHPEDVQERCTTQTLEFQIIDDNSDESVNFLKHFGASFVNPQADFVSTQFSLLERLPNVIGRPPALFAVGLFDFKQWLVIHLAFEHDPKQVHTAICIYPRNIAWQFNPPYSTPPLPFVFSPRPTTFVAHVIGHGWLQPTGHGGVFPASCLCGGGEATAGSEGASQLRGPKGQLPPAPGTAQRPGWWVAQVQWMDEICWNWMELGDVELWILTS